MPAGGGTNWVVSKSPLVDDGLRLQKKYNHVLVLTGGLKTLISARSIETILGLLKRHVSIIVGRNLILIPTYPYREVVKHHSMINPLTSPQYDMYYCIS